MAELPPFLDTFEPQDLPTGRAAATTTVAATVDPAVALGDPFGKLATPPLPRGLLPPIIEAFAEREAFTKGVVFHAPAMAALTVCAAAIPDHVELRVKVHEPWHESARLWLALIGLPSAKKTPVINTAMHPLTRLQKVAAARHQHAMIEWEKIPKDQRGPEPVPRRFTLNDTTIESRAKFSAY